MFVCVPVPLLFDQLAKKEEIRFVSNKVVYNSY